MHKENLDTFWYWINERHRIYLARQTGGEKPWTEDRILREYKFTNVFRELDTGTIWLRKNFRELHTNSESYLIFNIAWYRLFNLISTGKLIGWVNDYKRNDILTKLQLNYDCGIPIFTNAHIVRGWPGELKFKSIVAVMDKLWEAKDRLYGEITTISTLKHTTSLFKEFDLIGGFLAYEITSDLRHTSILKGASDIMTWANPGPGCRRGLLRLTPYLMGDDHAIELMHELLEMGHNRLGYHVPKLEMRDIEHSLCEFSKYMKVKLGEGRTRCRYNGG